MVELAVHRCLCVFIGDIARQPDDRPGEARANHLPLCIDRHMADQRRPLDILLQRTDVGRKRFRQHRHDPVGKIDTVAALIGFAIELAARTDVEGDIGDGDQCPEAAPVIRAVIRCRPDRIIMVPGIGRIDGDNWQMPKVFALLFRDGQLCRLLGLLDHGVWEVQRYFELVDRDQAERLGGERIAQYFLDPCLDLGAALERLGQHQIARLGIAQFQDRGAAADLPVDRL